jgi:hypothetical protein
VFTVQGLVLINTVVCYDSYRACVSSRCRAVRYGMVHPIRLSCVVRIRGRYHACITVVKVALSTSPGPHSLAGTGRDSSQAILWILLLLLCVC